MPYAILRIAKLGSHGAIGGAGEHIHRQRHTPNADPELARYNKRLVGSTDLMNDISARLEELNITPRKNAVLAVEHLITASPEFFNYKRTILPDGSVGLQGKTKLLAEFEQRTLAWLQQQYGAKNVVSVVVHKDEKSPHIHAVIVPIITKEIAVTRKTKKTPDRISRSETRTVLAARELFGERHQLRQMQTSFAQHMQELGLSRGLEGSKAEHTTVKDFYRLANAVTTDAGIELAHQLLTELGNRRQSKEAQELKAMKEALTTAGLDLYKGKVMSLSDASRARQADKEAAQAARLAAKTAQIPLATAPSTSNTSEEIPTAEKPDSPPVEQSLVETPFQRAHRLTMEQKPTGLSDYKLKLAGQGFTCFNLPGYGIEFRNPAKQLVARFDEKQGEALDRAFRKNSPPVVKLFVSTNSPSQVPKKGFRPS